LAGDLTNLPLKINASPEGLTNCSSRHTEHQVAQIAAKSAAQTNSIDGISHQLGESPRKPLDDGDLPVSIGGTEAGLSGATLERTVKDNERRDVLATISRAGEDLSGGTTF
jgi:hypothetical protein